MCAVSVGVTLLVLPGEVLTIDDARRSFLVFEGLVVEIDAGVEDGDTNGGSVERIAGAGNGAHNLSPSGIGDVSENFQRCVFGNKVHLVIRRQFLNDADWQLDRIRI